MSHQHNPPISCYQDITIDRIDFDWIKQCTKINFIRRAIKVIEDDGNYYIDLKNACEARLEELDPSLKRKRFDNNVTPEQKEEILREIGEWESRVVGNQGGRKHAAGDEDIQPEKYFEKSSALTKQQKVKMAENQRNKGNQSMKSKDFDQAIMYYTKSIEFDSSMASSYCNRALVYLKKKDFDKVIKDCEIAINLNPKYTKAYHRKAKAYQFQKKNVEAYKAFKQALALQPDNKQMNGQLKELRQQMTPEQLQKVDRPSALVQPSQFKRIVIEQQDDD